MDILLHKLGVSVQHLSILHQALNANYSDYREENRRIEALGIDIFARQLYAGGKVGFNVERQMILADIFQYIFVGRGYFAAVESVGNMQKFIELLLRVANLLIMQENLSVDDTLRSVVIRKLEANIGENDFFEPGYPAVRDDLDALKNYHGWIVGDVGTEFENIFDSLLPKRVGLAVELIVYAMLHLKKYGYVVPLLLSQKLIRGGAQGRTAHAVDYLAPPDFLLFREKGQVFGVEVGSAKDDQNTKFSIVTSIPLFSVRLGDHRQLQPFRCGKCGKWITYSSYVIQGLIDGAVSTDVDSINADAFLRNELPNVAEKDLAFYGEATDHNGTVRKLRYHYLCVREQQVVKDRVEGRTRHHTSGLILPVPIVKGLEILKED
jgi:hypothetical protein